MRSVTQAKGMIRSALGMDAQELNSTSHRKLEAGFALARVLVVLSSFLLTVRGPGESAPLGSAGILLALYSMYAAALILLSVTLLRKAPPFFLVAVHIADILWGCVLVSALESPYPVLLLFVFPMLTASFRWGPLATLGTTLALTAGMIIGVRGGNNDAGSQTAAFVTLLGFLIAHVDQNRRQASRALLFQPVHALPSGTPFQIVESVIEKAFRVFRPTSVQILVNEADTGRTFLWQAEASSASRPAVHCEEFDHANGNSYLQLLPLGEWVLDRSGTHDSLLVVSPVGRAKRQKGKILASFSDYFARRLTVISSAITMSNEWDGRIIVCDPSSKRSHRTSLQILRKFSVEVAPAIHTAQMCLRACRATAAEERARLARELHDGVIQSLLGADLCLETLKNQTGGFTEMQDDLRNVQEILRTEAKGLRHLVNDSRRRALGPARLVEYLSDLLERFQRDSGLKTHFFADLGHEPIPSRTSHEIARITEEAIANAKKHSRGSTLIVRVGSVADNWLLVIIDNGVGFNFLGTWTLDRLNSAGLGPRVIKERVQSLRGGLLIESTAAGARMEITIPKNSYPCSELSLESQSVQEHA